jgi:hypothetical protein
MDLFFDLIKSDKVKIRIMFTENRYRPRHLTREQIKDQYAILYYFFIRHAFGLIHSPKLAGGVTVRVYADELPLSATQFAVFKNYVERLTNRSEFRAAGIEFAAENIPQVKSHDHDILQCLDIVLGAMNFRLTKKHKDKNPGERRRSQKTLAKLKVYNHINKRIRDIYPRFNVGITTASRQRGQSVASCLQTLEFRLARHRVGRPVVAIHYGIPKQELGPSRHTGHPFSTQSRCSGDSVLVGY